MELRACIGRCGHQRVPLGAGGKASHEAGAGVGRHGELLTIVRPWQRTKSLAHWSTGQSWLKVVRGFCLYNWNCEEERKS